MKTDDDIICTIDDIQYWEDVTLMFTVDENGYSEQQADHSDGDFRCYHCTSCGEEFGNDSYDFEKAWPAVLKHIVEIEEDNE